MALNWKPREMGDCLLKIQINKMDIKIKKKNTQTDQLAIWDLFPCWLSSHCTQNKDLELTRRGLSCLEMFGVEAGGMSSQREAEVPDNRIRSGKAADSTLLTAHAQLWDPKPTEGGFRAQCSCCAPTWLTLFCLLQKPRCWC